MTEIFFCKRECYSLINRFVVQSAKVPRHNSQLINPAQLHRATSLCILMFYLDKENNGVNGDGTATLFQNSTGLYGNLFSSLRGNVVILLKGLFFIWLTYHVI